MPEITSKTFYPFTVKQLMVFQEEIKEAGSFEKLMRQKEALKYIGGERWEVTMQDIEYYKDKYLIGIYKPLREHYSTDRPFAFWSRMNLMLSKAEKLL
jgi:hypothetical protein